MTKRTDRRLADIELALWIQPISRELALEAFEHFKNTGELPDDIRVAETIGVWVVYGRDNVFAGTPTKVRDEGMAALLSEAIWGTGMVRAAAKHVLQAAAQSGLDVTEPLFADHVELPEFGGFGLELMGIPERFAVPPYEDQAARLFKRVAKIRAKVPYNDNGCWKRRMLAAVHEFQTTGERPDDKLMMDLILVLGELTTLIRHAVHGADVAEEMAVFDAIGTAKREDRDTAIGKLQALVAAGHFALQET